MEDVQLERILVRVGRLERESRFWRMVSVFLVLSFGSVLLLGAGKSEEMGVPGELRARQFVLVDERGTVVGRLGPLHNGAMGLGFYEMGKKSRVLLSVDQEGGSSLSLIGKDGQGSLLLKADGTGATGLRLLDKQWKTRAALATWPDGSPFVQLTDREGKDRALLGYAEVVVDGAGELIKRSESSLVLLNGDRAILWRAP